MKAKLIAVLAVAIAAAYYGYSKFTQPKIVAWGDSLTFGVGARGYHGYPDYLKDDGYEVVKRGYPGQTSSDIALRQGGLSPVLYTQEKTPGVYSVVRMSPDGDFRKYMERSYRGTMDGAEVILTRLRDNSWIIKSPTIIQCSQGCKFSSMEGRGEGDYLNIFWVGRENNLLYPRFILRDIDLMVSSLPKGSKYFVIGITPALDDSPEALQFIKSINASLAKTYGDRFVDMWGILHTRGIDMVNRLPALADAKSMRDGTIGATLYFDKVNFNDATYDAISRIISRKF
ncbi:hypothetical protein LZ654_20310 [Lelliottia amnigena]|uniref:SGNH/GDSL hydrolase family protein n=1 Tax=Lelliottia amnigena TaxID=61646 RepID=UPI001F199116|nr:hypothetical protein [Lelliottia amnigena]MCE9967153.1 hypothetical protein [Lelliottia amnigena]